MDISNAKLIESLIKDYNKTEEINKDLFKELMKRDLYDKFIEKVPKHILISSEGNVYLMTPGHNEDTKAEDRLKQADLMERMFSDYFNEKESTPKIKENVKNINSEIESKIKEKKGGSKNNKNVAATLEVLKDKITNFKDSKELKNLLRTYSKFHHYSASNKQLIYIQTLGQATRVAGYTTWEKIGRNVKKGEKGIKILAPSYYIKEVKQKDEQGNIILDKNGDPVLKKEKVMYFRPVHVFDISQTEGKELPELNRSIKEDITDFQKPLLKIANDNNIKVEFRSPREDPILANKINQKGADGYSSIGEIVINSSKSPSDQTATLIHELAHEKLHKEEDRLTLSKEQKEIEADAVKFVVLDKYGIDSKSEKYLALYQKDYDIMDSLDRIAYTSKEIINEIEDYREIKLEKYKMQEKLEIKYDLMNQLDVIEHSLNTNNFSGEEERLSSLKEQKSKIKDKLELLDKEGSITDKVQEVDKKLKEYSRIEKKFKRTKDMQISR